MQVAAVHAEVGRAVEAFRHRQLAHDLARVAVAVEMRVRREGDLAQPLLDADAAQHLHRVRQHLDAGADAGEAARLLVDLHVDADLPQRRGRGSPPMPAPTMAIEEFRLCHAIPTLSFRGASKLANPE